MRRVSAAMKRTMTLTNMHAALIGLDATEDSIRRTRSGRYEFSLEETRTYLARTEEGARALARLMKGGVLR
jgi:hypothetical protein